MRARLPDREGHVESHGTRIYWEEHGQGERAVLFIPPWQIVDNRVWKMQIPYFSRYFRTLSFDPPGNGRSDRPATGYDHDRMADHTRAVLDAAGVDRAALVCLSRGAWPGTILAVRHPERVERLVLTGSALSDEARADHNFLTPRDRYEGWDKYNANYWRTHFRDFLEFFMSQMYTESHSTKPREDGVSWGLGTTPEVLIATTLEWGCRSSAAELLAGVRVPTLIVHGTDDAVRPFELAERTHAAIPGSMLLPFEGSGHCPQARDPVRYNLAVRD
ncbi:MAG TPA: alpha/beta hydrolase, partial [Methylomirabilota bacterium]